MKLRMFSIPLTAALLAVFLAGSAFGVQDYSLVYYDGHLHTVRSDGSGSVAQIKATAISRGLDAVIITDHCKDLTLDEWRSLVAECRAVSDATFLALPGFEMTGSDGMLNRAHINALFADDPFVGMNRCELCPEEVWISPQNPDGTGAMYPENLARWVDYIHLQGGIAVHNHPSGSTSLDYGVDNIEVYNQGHVDDVFGYAKMLGYSDEAAWQLGITLNDFAVYGERDVNIPVAFPGIPDPIPLRLALYYATLSFSGIGQWLGAPEAPLNSWDDLLLAYVDGTLRRPIFGLANTDSHNTGDPVYSTVGVAKNGAYVKKGKKGLTARELFAAVKSGRTFATTGPSLSLEVNGRIMGETTRVFRGGAASITLSADSESPTAVLVKIDIIKNGEIMQTVSPMSPVYSATLVDSALTEDGYYRVEVTSYDPLSGAYQFAWSNPVFVRIFPRGNGHG
jgi:hypothetical protein